MKNNILIPAFISDMLKDTYTPIQEFLSSQYLLAIITIFAYYGNPLAFLLILSNTYHLERMSIAVSRSIILLFNVISNLSEDESDEELKDSFADKMNDANLKSFTVIIRIFVPDFTFSSATLTWDITIHKNNSVVETALTAAILALMFLPSSASLTYVCASVIIAYALNSLYLALSDLRSTKVGLYLSNTLFALVICSSLAPMLSSSYAVSLVLLNSSLFFKTIILSLISVYLSLYLTPESKRQASNGLVLFFQKISHTIAFASMRSSIKAATDTFNVILNTTISYAGSEFKHQHSDPMMLAILKVSANLLQTYFIAIVFVSASFIQPLHPLLYPSLIALQGSLFLITSLYRSYSSGNISDLIKAIPNLFYMSLIADKLMPETTVLRPLSDYIFNLKWMYIYNLMVGITTIKLAESMAMNTQASNNTPAPSSELPKTEVKSLLEDNASDINSQFADKDDIVLNKDQSPTWFMTA